MLTESQYVFLREVRLQIEHALNAFETSQTLQKQRADPIWQFKALDDFVHHCARVAHIFWPIKGRFKTRGEELRALVGINDQSPLASKALRNNLQHLDEYLEKWMKLPETEASFADLCIDVSVSVNSKRVYGLRQFESADTTYIFLGEKFPLLPMEEAVRKLDATIKALPSGPLRQL